MTEAQTVPKTVNCTADAETAYSAAMQGINFSQSQMQPQFQPIPSYWKFYFSSLS